MGLSVKGGKGAVKNLAGEGASVWGTKNSRWECGLTKMALWVGRGMGVAGRGKMGNENE